MLCVKSATYLGVLLAPSREFGKVVPEAPAERSVVWDRNHIPCSHLALALDVAAKVAGHPALVHGVEALEIFEAQSETIDLMVTDLVMPQMGGRDLAKKIAPTCPELRVLYLSGYTDSVVLQQGMLDPGSFFLQKPFTPADLAHKVREALDA